MEKYYWQKLGSCTVSNYDFLYEAQNSNYSVRKESNYGVLFIAKNLENQIAFADNNSWPFCLYHYMIYLSLFLPLKWKWK